MKKKVSVKSIVREGDKYICVQDLLLWIRESQVADMTMDLESVMNGLKEWQQND